MKIEIGISDKEREGNIKLLSAILADEVMLYTKTRNFHWNVTGESFMEVHKLLEKQYAELEETIDQVAERIGKLGGKAIGTMQEFLQISRLKESPGLYPSRNDMLKELLDDHQKIIIEIRKDINTSLEKNKDVGTIDFLTGIIEQHETIAWVLRRYLS